MRRRFEGGRYWTLILRCGDTQLAAFPPPILGGLKYCGRHGLQQVMYIKQSAA